MKSPEPRTPNPAAQPSPTERDLRFVPSEGPRKIEPVPERAEQEKERQRRDADAGDDGHV